MARTARTSINFSGVAHFNNKIKIELLFKRILKLQIHKQTQKISVNSCIRGKIKKHG